MYYNRFLRVFQEKIKKSRFNPKKYIKMWRAVCFKTNGSACKF